ncbi:unnamed protein product [Gongylonema pulchrum]|uniref:Epoxide hydrolase n=1 Tax=Gongylonema pulchrum TaxID=637853 RepID=A0A183D8B4_9BILA|nr:unnamed protein product [Gongylonema pulchrum]
MNSVVPSKVPPNELPDELRHLFLMFDHAVLEKWYFNEAESKPVVWKKEAIDEIIHSNDFITPYKPDGGYQKIIRLA